MKNHQQLAFVDTETTGLYASLHEVAEIALIFPKKSSLGGSYYDDFDEWVFHLPIDFSTADPMAIQLNNLYPRRATIINQTIPNDPDGYHVGSLSAVISPGVLGIQPCSPIKAAGLIAQLLHGRHLVGACPWFDAVFIEKFLRSNGQCGSWHYHLIDVEALMVGHLQVLRRFELQEDGNSNIPEITLPWRSEDLSRFVGIDPDLFEKHTALGDARWALAIYEEISRFDL